MGTEDNYNIIKHHASLLERREAREPSYAENKADLAEKIKPAVLIVHKAFLKYSRLTYKDAEIWKDLYKLERQIHNFWANL